MGNEFTVNQLVLIAMDNGDAGPDGAMGERGKAFYALGGGIFFEIGDGDRDEFVRRGFEFLDRFDLKAEEAIELENYKDEPSEGVIKIIQDIAGFVATVKSSHLAQFFDCLSQEFDSYHPSNDDE